MWWRISERISILNSKIKVNETDKIKRQEAITYKIVKQTPSVNDKWYVKYNRDSSTYYIGKEDQKKNTVINGNDDEENKKIKMRKRKIKDSIDEISQELLIKQTKKKNSAKKIANCSSRNTTKKKAKEKQK